MGKALICVSIVLVFSSYVTSDDQNEDISLGNIVSNPTESKYSTFDDEEVSPSDVSVGDKEVYTSDVSVDKASAIFFKKMHSSFIRPELKIGSKMIYFPISDTSGRTHIPSFHTAAISTTERPSTSTIVTCPKPIPYPKPADCEEIRRNGYNTSGIYTVYPRSRLSLCSLLVYCDMDTAGGGWTVIQRRGRFGGPVNYFSKDWRSYADGFGLLDQEFWLGNDNIYALTNQGAYTVRFDLQQKNGGRAYALYDRFWIDDELQKYKLHIGGFSGTAGDSMAYHNGMYFSTRDNDNDRTDKYNCAKDRSSGWWFNYCMECNLNGLYRDGYYYAPFNDGIDWHAFGGYKNSMVFTEIKIRPRNTCRKRAALRTSNDL